MAYLGTTPAVGYSKIEKQTLTGDGNTTYTLINPVGNEQELEVYVNNVRQEPGNAYTTFGTTLTMTGAVTANDSFYVVYQGKAQQTIDVPQNISVSSIRLFPTTVSSLPLASVSNGVKYVVTDANSRTFLSVAYGGGANTVPVFSNGTQWIIG